jgi:seryl-tRNA synthetase
LCPIRLLKNEALTLVKDAIYSANEVDTRQRAVIEAWFPGQGRYREITSTSNTTDFQSRRLDVRYRIEGKLAHVHTLNGTAMTARALLAVLENFQEADGSVAVPAVLHEFGAPRRLAVGRASAG